jgi:hypothetical protein
MWPRTSELEKIAKDNGRTWTAIGLLPVFLRVQVMPRNNETQTGVLLRVLFLW